MRGGLTVGLSLLIVALSAASPAARPLRYGGIGATVADFYAAHPHGPGNPPRGTTYYRVDGTRDGRVVDYHVVVAWESKRNASALLARLTGRLLPPDAKTVKAYNGYCAVYSSRWLGNVVFGLPRRSGTHHVFRTGYVIVYAPTRTRSWENEVNATVVPLCRG